MGALNLTHTLMGGTTENVNHVQDNFEDILTWSTGNVSDDNFSSTAGMYSAYRALRMVHGIIADNSGGVGDYRTNEQGQLVAEGSSTATATLLFHLEQADCTIAGRTPKLRVKAQAYVNATAPARTITFGLFPITSVGGTADAFQATLGTVTAGSTVAFASPLASTANQGNSGDFAFPTDGHFALGITLSGTLAADSTVNFTVELQQRWT